VRTKIPVTVDADFLGFLKEPCEVVPEICVVADGLCDHVTHFVDGYEGDNLFVDNGFVVALALSETEMYGFALVHAVAGVIGIGCCLDNAVRIGLEIA
jgi:hypothetical protein